MVKSVQSASSTVGSVKDEHEGEGEGWEDENEEKRDIEV